MRLRCREWLKWAARSISYSKCNNLLIKDKSLLAECHPIKLQGSRARETIWRRSVGRTKKPMLRAWWTFQSARPVCRALFDRRASRNHQCSEASLRTCKATKRVRIEILRARMSARAKLSAVEATTWVSLSSQVTQRVWHLDRWRLVTKVILKGTRVRTIKTISEDGDSLVHRVGVDFNLRHNEREIFNMSYDQVWIDSFGNSSTHWKLALSWSHNSAVYRALYYLKSLKRIFYFSDYF